MTRRLASPRRHRRMLRQRGNGAGIVDRQAPQDRVIGEHCSAGIGRGGEARERTEHRRPLARRHQLDARRRDDPGGAVGVEVRTHVVGCHVQHLGLVPTRKYRHRVDEAVPDESVLDRPGAAGTPAQEPAERARDRAREHGELLTARSGRGFHSGERRAGAGVQPAVVDHDRCVEVGREIDHDALRERYRLPVVAGSLAASCHRDPVSVRHAEHDREIGDIVRTDHDICDRLVRRRGGQHRRQPRMIA